MLLFRVVDCALLTCVAQVELHQAALCLARLRALRTRMGARGPPRRQTSRRRAAPRTLFSIYYKFIYSHRFDVVHQNVEKASGDLLTLFCPIELLCHLASLKLNRILTGPMRTLARILILNIIRNLIRNLLTLTLKSTYSRPGDEHGAH